VVAGSDDQLAGDEDGKVIFYGASQIPLEDKDFVWVRSDDHGDPPLVADHAAPTTLGGADALDYYGFWKLLDGLLEAAFYGRDRVYALGNTAEQRYMGRWSDGTPVNELIVTDQP